MNSLVKFSFIGFLFFIGTSFLSLVLVDSIIMTAILSGINAAVVIAVGVLKEPRLGLAFGFSSFPASLIRMLFYGIWGDFFLILFSAIVSSGILALYGYLPSKYYLKGRRLSRLIAGFVIMLFLDLGLSIFVEFVWIYRYDTYYLSFLPYVIQYYSCFLQLSVF